VTGLSVNSSVMEPPTPNAIPPLDIVSLEISRP
jgi:hypothetical protein